MINRLEDLWESADDGASTPFGPISLRSEEEFEHLMDAWFLERRNSIEFEILLARSRKVIARLLAEGVESPAMRKRARRLLSEIDGAFRAAEARGD